MSNAPRLLFPVLGMHRSGTSIATRGLACLGIALGERLIEGGAHDNPTGYFEDEALHALCEEALACVGSSWHDLAPLDSGAFEREDVRMLQSEALRLLRDRLDAHPRFGFKNPRTVRLAAFWQPVFERLDAEVRSVLVVRHPLSVTRSLSARDGFDTTKSAMLWLTHTLDGALGVGRAPAACLDYDALLGDPASTLERVASDLGLASPDEIALHAYTAGLLDPALRHSEFDADDLVGDPRVGELVEATWSRLRPVAQGEASLGEAGTRRALRGLRRRAADLAPLLGLASRHERVIAGLEHALDGERQKRASEAGELREQITMRERMIEERESLIALRDDAVRDLDAEIARQHTHIDELNAEIVNLRYEAGTQGAAFSEAKNRIETLWDVNERLRADHARAEAALHARVTELRREREALATERDAAEQRVEQAHAEGLRLADAAREESLRAEHAELDRTRHEVDHLHGLLMRTRDDLERRQTLHAEARSEADALRVELDQERQGSIEWFHAEAVQIARRLVDAAEALGRTRTWRWSRRIQHARDRNRRVRSLDATEHLRNLLVELQARARRHDMDAQTLLDFTRLVDETKGAILGGRIFRTLRRVLAFAPFGQRGEGTDGPVEILDLGIAELLEFAGRMARAPFTTALPTVDPGEAYLEPAKDARVDVVIPVYGDRAGTLDCIASVRRSRNRTPVEIVVIDDATPDPELAAELDRLAAAGSLTLLRNEHNLGFPATANRGMALHPERDVVLLNADTRVHGDWLDRLRAAAHTDWNVATATPFSNNAEICSYPRLCTVNPYPGASEQGRIDTALARVNAGRTLTIPTAVGFCMYLRRDALRLVGPFDALRFERGYGEENDLCMRLRARGLRNVLAADVYVAHAGGSSFGEEKQALVERGLRRLDELYPDYLDEVAAFIADDPMKALRVRTEAALLPRSGDPTVLFVTHARGGGTARHVHELAERLEREGVRVLLLSPEPSGSIRLEVNGGDEPWNLRFDVEDDFDSLLDALRIAGVGHIHFHHLIGLPDGVARLPERLAVTYDVTAHDYFAVCPRTHMIDASGVYCGEPEVEVCTACIAKIGSPVGRMIDVARWRARSQTLLAGARRVFVPSLDAASRLERYFEDVRWLVRPHPEAPWDADPVATPRRGDLRVAVVGAIGYHKGSQMLLACAKDAAERKLPLRFAVVGHTDCNDELLATRHVDITGPYEEHDLPALLAKARCQLAFLPSVWPETYCYTLSHVVRAQLYPVVFDLGAPAERVRAMGFGDVIPLATPVSAINDQLLSFEPEPFPRDRVETAHDREWPSCLKDYYDGLSLSAPGEGTRASRA